MAMKPVGTAIAVIDLDSNKMEQGLQRVYNSLVNGTVKTEDAFKQLGIKSDLTYARMAENAALAQLKIVTSTRSTQEDIIRAQQAYAEKFKALYNEQNAFKIALIQKENQANADYWQARIAQESAALQKSNQANADYWMKKTAFEKQAVQQSNQVNADYWLKKDAFEKQAIQQSNQANADYWLKRIALEQQSLQKSNQENADYWIKKSAFEKQAQQQSQQESSDYWVKRIAFEKAAMQKSQQENADYWLKRMAFEKQAVQQSEQITSDYWMKRMAFEKAAMNKAQQQSADYWMARMAFERKAGHQLSQQSEAMWKTMGIRPTAAIEADKQAVLASYASLTTAAKGNQQELINLERAKNDQLKKLNAEMVGQHEMSMASMTRAVLRFYAAYYVVSTVFSAVSSAIMSGIKAIDEFKISTIAVAAQITSLQGNNNVAENYKNALAYAEKLNLKLMEIDANSFANFQQIQLMNRAMTNHGVILDTNNKKQIESFTAITNTIALLTTGQNKEIQASQEMNALMTGRVKATDRVAMMIDGIIKQEGIYKNGLAEVVALGKQHGDTIQRLYPYFSGIIAASGDISKTWESIGSSLETVWGIVQRGLFKDMYKSLVTNGREIAEWTRKNADKIIEQINRAYDTVAYMIKGMIILLGAFAAVSVTKFFIAGGAATAWGKAVEIAGTQATLALSKVKLAFSGFATFIMGHSIGTWLMDEFESVRLFGVKMVETLINTWEWAKKTFEMFVEAIKNPFASQEETMDRNAAINAKYEKEQAARNAIFLQMAEESTNAYKKTLAERKKAEADAIIKTPDIPPPPPEKTRTAAKDHSDMLKTMSEDNKHYYEDAINQAKAAEKASQQAGQNELVTIDTLLNARLDALTERKRREEEMARLEVQYASEANDIANKNAEAGAEKTMYDAKAVLAAKFHSIEIGFITDANKAEADAGLKREGYHTKNAETIAKLYHTIDQYSDESLETQIDALKSYYTQSQRWVEATAKGRLLIETAEAEDELKLRRDNEQAKYNIALNYLEDTEGAYSKTSRAIYELSLKNQAAELASKMKSNMIAFDQEKWIAEQLFKYENQNERKIYDMKIKYLEDMGLEYTKAYRDLAIARIKNEADALEKEFQKAAGATGMTKEQQDQITAEQDLTQKLMTEWEERLRAYADYLKGMGDKEGSNTALKAAEEMANKKIELQNKVKDNAIEAQQTMFDKEAWTNKKIQELDINTAKSYIGNIGNMLDAAMSMYDTESSEYKRIFDLKKGIQIAELALDQVKNIQTIAGYFAVQAAASSAAVANAGAAVTGASIGVGPTGFATAAAMIALMAGVFAMYGIASSGGSPSVSAPAALPAQGASGRLGAEAGVASESIANSIELLQDTYDMESTKLTRIYEEMRDLNRNITGLLTSIVRTGGISAGGYAEITAIGPQQQAWEDVGNYINIAAGALLDPITGTINALLGGLVGSLVGAVFGGDTKTDVQWAGIAIGDMLVSELLNGVQVSAQTFASFHNETSGGLWGGSSNEFWTEYYDNLDPQVTEALTMVFKSMSDTLVYLAEGLGTDVQAVYDYIFEGGQIDLKDQTTEQMNETLNEYFSTMMDAAVYDLFGEILIQYQKIDEGLLETAIRIIRDKEVILSMLEMTGQGFSGTEEEAIALSQSLITLAGDLESLADAANSFYENFTTDAEKQADLSNQLYEVMTEMNMALPASRDGYADLVAGLDLSTESGQQTYVMLLQLAEASDRYYEAIEEAVKTVNDISVYYYDMMGVTTDLEKELAAINAEFNKAYDAAVLLESSEADLLAIRGAQADVINKTIADSNAAYWKQVNEWMGTTDSLTETIADMNAFFNAQYTITKLLGGSEADLLYIRETEAAVIAKTIADWEQGITDYYNSQMGLTSDLQNSINEVTKYYDAAIKTATLLGKSEAELNAIREQESDIIKKLTAAWKQSFVQPFIDIGIAFMEWAQAMAGYTSWQIAGNTYKYKMAMIEQKEYDSPEDKMAAQRDALAELYSAVIAGLQKTYEALISLNKELSQSIEDITLSAMDSAGQADFYLDRAVKNYQGLAVLADEQIPDAVSGIKDDLLKYYELEKKIISEKYTAEIDAINARYDAEIQNIEAVRDKLNSLKYSQYNLALPSSKATMAAGDYDKLYASAQTGDKDAVSKYLSFTDTYLQKSQDAFKSSQKYQDIYAKVMNDIGKLDTKPGVSIENLTEEQNALIKAQTDMMNKELKNLDDGVIAVLEMLQDEVAKRISSTLLNMEVVLNELIKVIAAGYDEVTNSLMSEDTGQDIVKELVKFAKGIGEFWIEFDKRQDTRNSAITTKLTDFMSGVGNYFIAFDANQNTRTGTINTAIGLMRVDNSSLFATNYSWLSTINSTLLSFMSGVGNYWIAFDANEAARAFSLQTLIGLSMMNDNALFATNYGWLSSIVTAIEALDLSVTINVPAPIIINPLPAPLPDPFKDQWPPGTGDDMPVGYADGGWPSGPDSGYLAMLHGKEVVLSKPRPVSDVGSGASNKETNDLLRSLIAAVQDGKVIQIDGKPIAQIADQVRINANRRPGNETRRIV